MELASGHEVVPVEDEEMEKKRKDFAGFKGSWIRILPGGWFLPRKFLKFANRIYNFEIRETDVILMTYPKCGTTWMQEIIWTMRNNPQLNHPKQSTSPMARVPFLDFDMLMLNKDKGGSISKSHIVEMFRELCPGKAPDDGVNLQLAEAIPDPRTIKTHLPFPLMPPSLLDTAKVVYIARNPKDVVVSCHHHNKIAPVFDYVGSFEDFVQYFVEDGLTYGPYWYHLKEAWEKRHHPNLHFIFYEDMQANLPEELKRLDAFLGPHLTEAQLEAIGHYASFDRMREREESAKRQMSGDIRKEDEISEGERRTAEYAKNEGGFFRKGEVADWKNRLTPEMSAKIDQWTRDHLSNLGINFRYEI
ncbi:sulfotransferase 1A1-like [Palaemon carinicauda]|uniref:sulfotransferase 1A1-like n=1 Tax=Palaemon carinicauda TaxID=392227 RepID=UPI0035B5D167